MVGCNNKEPSASQKSTSKNLEEIQQKTKTVARDMEKYSFEQKTNFVEKMQIQLKSIEKYLKALSAKIEDAGEEIKTEANPKVQALSDQAAQLNAQLEDLRHSTESTWDQVKAESQKTLDSIKEGFQGSGQWLSDKIEP